uniref:Magnesium-dependent phosphatase 1 n=1 Tax=Photinus pyralis TaxID=7054 RepID=A0A1Y1KMZ2_PHOPY
MAASTSSTETRPKFIVFDLDYTLWPFWVDTHVTPPFRKSSSGKIVDARGATISCYKEVPKVLKKLNEDGYTLGVASRTSEIQGANQLIKLFGWSKYFKYKEIYPGSKTAHFARFKKQLEVPYSDMLFFDDESRNIRDLKEVGVTSILVKDGVDAKVVEMGIREYRNEHSA